MLLRVKRAANQQIQKLMPKITANIPQFATASIVNPLKHNNLNVKHCLRGTFCRFRATSGRKLASN